MIAPIAARISILSALLVAVLVTGCGSSGGSDSTPASSTTSKAKPKGKPAFGLGPHLIAPGELQGFAPSKVSAAKKPLAWLTLGGLAPEGYRKEARRLKNLGFVAGANEQFDPTGESAAQAVSVVERFKTEAAAKSELATQVEKTRTTSKGSFVPFKVPGIPNARGFDLPGPKSNGHNVVFVDGPFYHLVGTGFRKGDKSPPSREVVIAAVQAMYKRLHGKSSTSQSASVP
jgi:hypothetical protein